MKKLLLCCFLILTSPVFAAERTDYRDFTPEKRQQVTDRWNASFNKVGKDIGYARDYASGKMDTVVKQINQNHEVRTQIRDSGYDPDTGKKIRIEANVTQTANKAKVASTLTDRLKKAADFAKKSGKASIPAFVGGAAVQALVDGVGWVMDEGGKVTKKPVQDNTNPHLQNCYQWNGNCVVSMAEAVTISRAYSVENYPSYNITSHKVVGVTINFYDKDGVVVDIYTWSYAENPNYNPSAPPPENVEVTPEQLAEALKNALESNNPALAAAIAEAIKAAYTPEGPLLASIGDEQANGLAVDAADTARDAVNKASKNTGSEPSSKGKPGYYNITDGEKTIEGNVYETDPKGSITPQPDTGTGTEPGTGTGTGTGTSTGGATLELPAFCEWAGIVCDFIEWYKTQPEDDSPELPEHELEKKEIDKDLLNIGGSSCPQDLTVNWSGLPFGITINESFEMQPYCNELEPLKYVFILITTCLCAFMFVRL
jgi:hypothetical protein